MKGLSTIFRVIESNLNEPNECNRHKLFMQTNVPKEIEKERESAIGWSIGRSVMYTICV